MSVTYGDWRQGQKTRNQEQSGHQASCPSSVPSPHEPSSSSSERPAANRKEHTLTGAGGHLPWDLSKQTHACGDRVNTSELGPL